MTITPLNSRTEMYHKFAQFLATRYPVDKPERIEIRLEDYKYIPYRVNGELQKAYATVNNIKNTDKLVIRLAVGKNNTTKRNRLNSIAHEYCHCLQFYRGEVFNSDWDAKLELEAMDFAKRVVDEYFNIN